LQEREFMRKRNYPLRLQPSLMAEAREAAESEGVTLNHLFNVAVAEKLSALRTGKYFQERLGRADREKTIRILDRAGKGNPPREGDQLPTGGPQGFGKKAKPVVQPAPPQDEQRAEQTAQPPGRATPQFGLLKRKLEKFRHL
jgi:hypothetical protein